MFVCAIFFLCFFLFVEVRGCAWPTVVVVVCVCALMIEIWEGRRSNKGERMNVVVIYVRE
jgi:hypothetical protein